MGPSERSERLERLVRRKKEPMQDLSVSETCAVLGVTPPTVYKLLNTGQLRGYRVGRSRRISGESIQLLRSGKAKKNSAPAEPIYKGLSGYPNVPNPSKTDDIALPRSAGIYFFWKDRKVVYVGQSVDIKRRIQEHSKLEHMRDLPVSFLCFKESDLMFAEAFYIGMCKPKFNAMKPEDRA